MKASIEKYNLHKYVYPADGPGLTLVNHTGCCYNNNNKTESSIEQKVILGNLEGNPRLSFIE